MKDLVSVILAVYNESAFLEAVVHSLLQQSTALADVEILIINGMSTDNSAKIAKRLAANDTRIRVFDNPKRIAPSAWNIGLTNARGKYVAIMGAHCEYESNYLEVCLRELLKHGAVGCSGRLQARAPNNSLQARLALWILSHPFGVSGSSTRTHPEGFADTIPYPVFVKQVLLDLGGFDERLVRNEDNDINYRLTQAGHKLYYTWQTSCIYYTRQNLSAMLRYAQNNGSWCAVSFLNEPQSLGIYHYVPAAFALSVVHANLWIILTFIVEEISILIAIIASSPIIAHLIIGFMASLVIFARSKHPGALMLPVFFLAFHFVYGLAFLMRLPTARLQKNIANTSTPK